MKSELIQRLVSNGIVAVLRMDDGAPMPHVCEALFAGGCTALEVTMTTPNALQVITETSRHFSHKAIIGVGSVLDDVTARMAILAGAEFVVSPVLRPDVIAICRRYGIPVVCGAYTPTEALAAWEAGADYIKLFPADKLGADYIKAMRGPMPQLEIVPTGGVTADNCGTFIKAGCAAVAAGGSLVSPAAVKEKNWTLITETARAFVQNIKAARSAA